MRVLARIYATPKILAKMDDGVFDQITNVATCPASGNTPFACPTAIGARGPNG
jgi:RNA-splicing ligase RtcB